MNVQHVDIKIPLAGSQTPNLEPLIPVFHRWVRERVFGELLIDVADYRHVPQGPGVMVIGHEGNYSLDLTDGVPGVRYVRKTPVEGDNAAVFAQALSALAVVGKLLEEDAALAGAFRFNWRVLELRINDRWLAPNRPETFASLKPDLTHFFDTLVGPGKVELEHNANPRELFKVTVRSAAPIRMTPAPHLPS